MSPRFLLILVVSACWAPPTAFARADAAGSVNSLELWSRQRGAFGDDQNPTKLRPKALDPEKLKFKRRKINDAQYNRVVTVRGVPLKAVIEKFDRGASEDL